MRVNAEFWEGKVETVAEFDIFFENSQVMEASKDKLFWEILKNFKWKGDACKCRILREKFEAVVEFL